MQSLISTDQLVNYNANEAGPIILALAFVIGLGGISAAALIMCHGWDHIKSAGFNWSQRRVEIVCR